MALKIAQRRLSRYFDAFYNLVHVHQLVQPYPYFQVCLSIGTDTSLNSYFRQLCKARSINLDSGATLLPAFISSYFICRYAFADMPLSLKAFNQQFERYINTKGFEYFTPSFVVDLCSKLYEDKDVYDCFVSFFYD